MTVSLRERVNSYDELDAKLALKDYAVSGNKTNNSTGHHSDSSKQISGTGTSGNGTQPLQGESRQSITSGDLGISHSDLQADVKKKYKSLKEHKNKFKLSSKDISENDYNNN